MLSGQTLIGIFVTKVYNPNSDSWPLEWYFKDVYLWISNDTKYIQSLKDLKLIEFQVQDQNISKNKLKL